jgi:hypothetical protein
MTPQRIRRARTPVALAATLCASVWVAGAGLTTDDAPPPPAEPTPPAQPASASQPAPGQSTPASPSSLPAAPPPAREPEPPPPDAQADDAGEGEGAIPDDSPRHDEPDDGVEAEVTLRDGRRVIGLLESDEPGKPVTLRISNVPTTFAREEVERVDRLPSVMERYRAMRAAIGEEDSARRLLLAQWLLDRRKFGTAMAEVKAVLERDPRDRDARELRVLVEQQRVLAERGRAAREGGAPARARPPRAGPVEPAFPLLTAADINILRLYEVDLRNPPRMLVPRETIERLLTRYADSPLVPATREGRDALFRRRPEQIVELMFSLRARELYPEVQVLDHPESMRRFRDDVHRGWLMNACATTKCHGGAEAGRLRLARERPNADATVYTNFLIMDRFRLADGTPLISYEAPASSPLLQAALPRERSQRPHPAVGGRDIRPIFNDADDPRFQQAVAWIRSMYQPRPEYPIEYTPPAPSEPPARAPDAPAR